jgi:MFS transporter, MFS domain-containing protein family, molybdate-anion transporter
VASRSLTDRVGRKKGCLLYGVVYILSCLVYHTPSFKILLLGCLLDGIANSLLNSSFESWLVHGACFFAIGVAAG